MADDKEKIKVTDRRIFGADGQLLEPSQSQDFEKSFSDVAADFSAASAASGKESQPMEMTFQLLIMSLSTTALVQLGLAPNPANGKTEKDLMNAKQTIDILGILEEKTKGNLTPEESHLLEQCLYDLKMSYISLLKK
jgi:uncharacterized protein DUF1844